MTGLELGQPDDESLEGTSGVGVGQRFLGLTQQRLVHRPYDRLDESLLRREVAAHRAHADSRPAGDLLDRRFHPRLGEDGLRRGEDPLAVPPGIRAPGRVARTRRGTFRFKRKHDSDYSRIRNRYSTSDPARPTPRTPQSPE